MEQAEQRLPWTLESPGKEAKGSEVAVDALRGFPVQMKLFPEGRPRPRWQRLGLLWWKVGPFPGTAAEKGESLVPSPSMDASHPGRMAITVFNVSD